MQTRLTYTSMWLEVCGPHSVDEAETTNTLWRYLYIHTMSNHHRLVVRQQRDVTSKQGSALDGGDSQ